MSNPNHDTVEIAAPPPPVPEAPEPFSSLIAVDISGLSHEGKRRPSNEDHFLVVRFGRLHETMHTNIPPNELVLNSKEIGYAMMVADGLGGHAGGEVASKLAISTLLNLALSTPDWILRFDDEAQTREAIRRARDRYEEVDAVVTEQAGADASLEGMATTLTLVWSLGRDLFVGHVGDSRAYLFREGSLRQLTHDHTVTQDMVDRGEITADEAVTHKMRHILTNAVGSTQRKVRPETHKLVLKQGDSVMLCSDGLTDMVGNDLIAQTLAGPGSSQDMCKKLFNLAMEAGGKDNITVVIARYRFPKT